MTRQQPPRRPRPGGKTLFTPGASAARQSLERASLRPLAAAASLPRWLPPVVLAALFVTGCSVRGWAGSAAFLLVAAFTGWLASLSWPTLSPPGRLLRVVVIAALLGLAGWQGAR